MSKIISVIQFAQYQEFNELYNKSIECADASRLQSTIEKMTGLRDQIVLTLKTAPTSVSHHHLPFEITVDSEILTNEIQDKLETMITHYLAVTSTPSPSSRTVTLITPPAPPATERPKGSGQVKDYAIGFSNIAANCWANSLLSMVVFVPSFKRAYETVALHYANDPTSDLNRLHGSALLNALKAYDAALTQKQSVPPLVTQDVRLAFNHLFGRRSASGQELFSINSYAHEDAYEAMQMLMGRYEDILKIQNRFDSPPSLYCPLETKRLYRPESAPKNADPVKLSRDGYSRLKDDNSSVHVAFDYQILLDLHNTGHLSFSALLSNFFRSASTHDSEPGTYLRADGKEQQFTLIGEARQFVRIPDEFLLTLKRFGAGMDGRGFKITAPIMINRLITLPIEATKKAEATAYELDAFIVHSGGFGGGHYVCYKKVNDKWIEANDANVRFVTDAEIDQILHGQKAPNFTSYLHHYSKVPQSRQIEAIAAAENALLALPAIPGLNELEIAKFSKEKQACEQAVLHLEQYSTLLISGADLGTLSNALKKLELSAPEIINTLRHAIWLHDQTPDIFEYGASALNANPRKLQEIQLPWLYSPQKTLLEQMIAIQKAKSAIAAEKLKEAQLQTFIATLNDPLASNSTLLTALKALPDVIQWELHGLVYKSHEIKFGKATVDRAEYGRNALENGNLRKVLTEATESVLNIFGKNIVEQLLTAYHIKAEKLHYGYEKEQLRAFHNLLLLGAPTNNQLVKAFERLEVRPQLKEKLFWLIWYSRGMPNIADFGLNTFKNNPRCFLQIRNGILAEPPLCKANANILAQMVGLLDYQSI